MKLEAKYKKISIVVAIYNAERTIEECLNSILNQYYPKKKYEIIIIDGGSQDSTIKIVEKLMKKNKNIKILHNSGKFSEGRGMGRDIGLKASRGEIVIQIDHDNILSNRNWLREMLFPFYDNPKIEVVQSLLSYKKSDSSFIRYVNSLGVEDPFAAPYSLVSQVTLYPKRFRLIKNRYFLYQLNEKKILFAGANGCAFKKSALEKIGGWTRDVDVFADLAKYRTKVAIIKNSKVLHKTSSDIKSFINKKKRYFKRFIQEQHREKSFRWVEKGISGKARFILRVIFNLSLIGPFILALKQVLKTGNVFWFWHPIILFIITLEYGILTLLNLRNFLEYSFRE